MNVLDLYFKKKASLFEKVDYYLFQHRDFLGLGSIISFCVSFIMGFVLLMENAHLDKLKNHYSKPAQAIYESIKNIETLSIIFYFFFISSCVFSILFIVYIRKDECFLFQNKKFLTFLHENLMENYNFNVVNKLKNILDFNGKTNIIKLLEFITDNADKKHGVYNYEIIETKSNKSYRIYHYIGNIVEYDGDHSNGGIYLFSKDGKIYEDVICKNQSLLIKLLSLVKIKDDEDEILKKLKQKIKNNIAKEEKLKKDNDKKRKYLDFLNID